MQFYLSSGDNAAYLYIKPDTKWQRQLQSFNAELAKIMEQAKSAGVPLVAVFVPNRAQAAMISRGHWPAGHDPFKLQDEVRESIVSGGGHFVDILHDYRGLPSPERDYFPVDGHPDAEGQATIFRFLARELTNGVVPEIRSVNSPDIAMAPRK